MSNKVFAVIIAVLGMTGYVAVKKKDEPPETPRPGVEQADKGQKHMADGTMPYGDSEPPLLETIVHTFHGRHTNKRFLT